MPNKIEIAEYLRQVKLTYGSYSLSLIFLNDPSLYGLIESRGLDVGSTVSLGRQNGTYYSGIDIYCSIEASCGNPVFNMTFLKLWFMGVISLTGDYLKQNDYFDKRPELEFFRHIRNAISHGNKFTFKKNEPKRPAQFGDFVICHELQGRTFLFDYMNPGDLFDLLDYLERYLRE
jgi:hypothetical protein